MKITTKVVLCAILLALSLQSPAIAGWEFKPPGEIAKNVTKRLAKAAQDNPEETMEIVDQVTGNNDHATGNDDHATGNDDHATGNDDHENEGNQE